MAHKGFWRELKRRHVYRVAAAYAIVGWLLIQVATQVFPIFHFPDWIDQAVVLLILIGFPIALVLAWAFDATPQGIVRTDASFAGDAANASSLRRSHRAGIAVGLIGVLIAVAAGAGWWYTQHGRAIVAQESRVASTHSPSAKAPVVRPALGVAAAAVGSPIAAQLISAKSIAVLPFVDESSDKDQQYFSDGLSEDLITALSQFAGLKVISRNSSFEFRHSQQDSASIGRKLGVAHLLEGSVRHAGDMVRVSAELVNAPDGSALWSQHYDRPYKDLFALQDAITRDVAASLKARLLDSQGAVEQSDRPPSGNLDAWNAYSHGRFYAVLVSPEDAGKAIDFFRQAIAIDPRYARAYAALSYAETTLGATFLGGEQQRQAFAKARAAADQALQLNPRMAMGHVARGSLLAWADFDWTGAQAEFRRAVALSPNDGLANFELGNVLNTLGHPEQAIALIRQSIAIDPRNSSNSYWLGWDLAAAGQLEAAEQAARKAIALTPGKPFLPTGLAIIEIQRGHAKAALVAAQLEPPGSWRDFALALALQVGDDRAAADAALKTLVAGNAEAMAYQIAEVYGLRKQPDDMFAWLDHAWDNRDPGIQRLLTDPFILPYRNDPRFAAFCKKVGLPTTTDAKALP